jgi:L-phenylalanine/L-methionine N-acetyltransferase
MKIINYDKKYAKQIIDLWLSPEVMKNTLSSKEKTNVKKLNQRAKNNEKNFFIAVEKEKVVGFSAIRINNGRKNHSADFVIFVSPEFHRKRIGSKLIKKLFERAKKKKLKRIELGVFADNKKAISFYEKHGFVKEGLKKKALQRNKKLFDEIIMARLL